MTGNVFIELQKVIKIFIFCFAGNDGKNIDFDKIYPASFDLENIIVITSSDISGNLAQGQILVVYQLIF